MTYICCSHCHEECKPTSASMREFERISVSTNSDKTELTIWCNRHRCAVASIGVAGFLKVIAPRGLAGQKVFSEMTAAEVNDKGPGSGS